MKLLLKRLQTDWPSWLAVSFFALLPFRRLSEIPLSIFALSLPFLLRNPGHRQHIRHVATFVVPVFLCFWIPMVVSSFDSFIPQKSWGSSLAALRFLAAALSMGCIGAWVGTRFLATEEGGALEINKKKIVQSSDEGTRVSTAYTGKTLDVEHCRH